MDRYFRQFMTIGSRYGVSHQMLYIVDVRNEQSIGVTRYDNLLKITEKSGIIVWIIYYTKTHKNEEKIW